MKDFSEGRFAWQNDRFVKWRNAKAHTASHAFLYGTGVFEGIACYKTARGPALFRLQDHVERLLGSARIMKMNVDYTKRQIEKACAELVEKNGFDECYLRPVISYGYGKIGLAPMNLKTDLTILAWRQKNYLGKEAQENGIRLMTSSYLRVFAKPANSR